MGFKVKQVMQSKKSGYVQFSDIIGIILIGRLRFVFVVLVHLCIFRNIAIRIFINLRELCCAYFYFLSEYQDRVYE